MRALRPANAEKAPPCSSRHTPAKGGVWMRNNHLHEQVNGHRLPQRAQSSAPEFTQLLRELFEEHIVFNRVMGLKISHIGD
jgi:arylamine N-acetyltransferase